MLIVMVRYSVGSLSTPVGKQVWLVQRSLFADDISVALGGDSCQLTYKYKSTGQVSHLWQRPTSDIGKDSGWACFRFGQVGNAEVWNWSTETETEVRKWEEKLPIGVWCITDSWLCLVGKGWLSQSDVRAKHWYIELQWALTQSFSMTTWVLCCGLIPRPRWLFASVSGVVLLLVEPLAKTLTTLASASLSRHFRSIEPTWLPHSWFILVWVWLLHEIATLAKVLGPKIQFSHRRD